jgi:MFS family permease
MQRSIEPTSASHLRTIVMLSSGNFLEAYDFMVFGYFAAAIGKAFFPLEGKSASLILSLLTFGVGFLARPVGAVILGGYMDMFSKRRGLILTLALMAIGTATVVLTPTFATIGWLAPAIVVTGRLVQGMSFGAETGGVSVYLADVATAQRRGFYVAWQAAGAQLAVAVAAIGGLLSRRVLTHDQLLNWGWRFPLAVGCILIPIVFVMRRSLDEPGASHSAPIPRTAASYLRDLATHWRICLTGALIMTVSGTSFYFIAIYAPTFGTIYLKLQDTLVMQATLWIGLLSFILLPTMGFLSDVIGRYRQLVICASLMLVTAYPAVAWIAAAPSFNRLLLAFVWLSVLSCGYIGAMVAYLTEILPRGIRVATFSLAYSLGAAIFGGFTPAICTYLIDVTGTNAAPGVWLAFASLLGLGALLAVRRTRSEAPATIQG